MRVLDARTAAPHPPVVLLLHGLLASGDTFGREFDALAHHATVLVPDLVGFGRTRTDTDHDAGVSAQITALDAALTHLGLAERPVLVVGHSMGGVLALHWAARHTERTVAAVTLCAPLYRNTEEADSRIQELGHLEAFLAADAPVPRTVCDWMCRHRTAGSWLAVALRPELPVPVARATVQHSWRTYRTAYDGLVRAPDWQHAIRQLSDADVPVVLGLGDRDPVPVPGLADTLASQHASARVAVVAQADHDLPMTHAAWATQLITQHLPTLSISRT